VQQQRKIQTGVIVADNKRFIAYPMSAGMYKYLEAIMDSGLLTGDLGDNDLSHNLKDVVHAVHHILAGGKAHVVIDAPGGANKVAELDKLLEDGTESANQLNAAAGIYVSIAP
jgi:hypothetical protein